MIKDCPLCFFEVEREGPSCECCGHEFVTITDDGGWEDFKETGMGFESKVLAAVGDVIPRSASFTNGSLSVVNVGVGEIDRVLDAIREVAPYTPVNARQIGDDEYVIDFDMPGVTDS
jgi:hypothetical protein